MCAILQIDGDTGKFSRSDVLCPGWSRSGRESGMRRTGCEDKRLLTGAPSQAKKNA